MSDTLTQDLWPDINDREKGKGMLEEYMTGKNIKYKPELKFIYSEKATKFCEISTADLSCVVTVHC